jgi:hypothetical protein
MVFTPVVETTDAQGNVRYLVPKDLGDGVLRIAWTDYLGVEHGFENEPDVSPPVATDVRFTDYLGARRDIPFSSFEFLGPWQNAFRTVQQIAANVIAGVGV